ncbi:MAG: hypothetical protein M0011_09040 [Elusimicrobia bacterium]|nr:hypothetical protein [Elusimicrobiota bacterium]
MFRKLLITATFLAGCSCPVFCGEQKYEIIRYSLHSPEELVRCWTGAEELSAKFPKLSPAEILQLYQYEECGFRSMRGTIEDYEANAVYLSTWGVLGVKYLKAHPDRYREIVHREFDASAERFPSRVLLDLLIKKAPGSPERWAIEWDLDYADFIRQFSYDHSGRSKGKSCAKYYNDYVKSHKELQEAYTTEEINNRIRDCEAARERYKKGLKILFEKFKDKPVVPKLYDPDETNVDSKEYFGIS